MQKRFKGYPNLYLKHNEIFEEQLSLVIIERVPTEVENKEGIEFMPHHGVFRADCETTKLRIVFDCSAKTSSDHLSRNDRLMNSSNYIPNLIEVFAKIQTPSVCSYSRCRKGIFTDRNWGGRSRKFAFL